MNDVELLPLKQNALANMFMRDEVETHTIVFKISDCEVGQEVTSKYDKLTSITYKKIKIPYKENNVKITWIGTILESDNVIIAKSFNVRFMSSSYNGDYFYYIRLEGPRTEDIPTNTKIKVKYYKSLANYTSSDLIHGQSATGVNNTDCIQLAIKDNDKIKYIQRVAYTDENKNLTYISRRLVNKVINPYDASQLQIMQDTSSGTTAFTTSDNTTYVSGSGKNNRPLQILQVNYKGKSAHGISNLAGSGCSVCSKAMIFSYITGKNITVQDICDASYKFESEITRNPNAAFCNYFGVSFISRNYSSISKSSIIYNLNQGNIVEICTTDKRWANISHQMGLLSYQKYNGQDYVYVTTSSSGKPTFAPDWGEATSTGHNGWYLLDKLTSNIYKHMIYKNSKGVLNYRPGGGSSTTNTNQSLLTTTTNTSLQTNDTTIPTNLKVWMGWTYYEKSPGYGDIEAILGVGDSNNAYGEFQFDIRMGSDVCTLIKGIFSNNILSSEFGTYFEPFKNYWPNIPESKKNDLASAFDDALTRFNTETSEDRKEYIRQTLNNLELSIAITRYLTGGTDDNAVNVLDLASKNGLMWNRNDDWERRVLVGALWSMANRNGTGDKILSCIKAMASAGTNIKNILRAGYKEQASHHKGWESEHRWNPDDTTLESEYTCAITYLDSQGTKPEGTRSASEDITNIEITSSVVFQDYSAGPIIMQEDSFNFGFVGNKDFSLTLNPVIKPVSKIGYKGATCNIACNGIIEFDVNDNSVITNISGPYWFLYLNEGHFCFEICDVNNNIRTYKSSKKIEHCELENIQNSKTIWITKKKELNSTNCNYKLEYGLTQNIHQLPEKMFELDNDTMNLSYNLDFNENRKLVLGGKLNIESRGLKSNDEDTVYITKNINIKGESYLHDVQNEYDFTISNINPYQLLESDV